MEDVDFSDDFCRFIQANIPAVDAAELLLLLHQRPGEAFSAEEAAAKLGPGVTPADIARHLERFEACGLVATARATRHQYRPNNELAGHVDRLAQAYKQRPVTLIRVIYAFRDSGIRSFADAFKLRKD